MATYGLTSVGGPKKPTTRRIRPSAVNSLKSVSRNHSDLSGLKGKDEGHSSRVENLVEVHSECQPDHRSLQQKAGKILALLMKMMHRGEPADKLGGECHGRPDESGSGDHDFDIRNITQRHVVSPQACKAQHSKVSSDEDGKSLPVAGEEEVAGIRLLTQNV